jgi:hypothetical protein
MFCRPTKKFLLLCFVALSTWAQAQYELPDEIFQRTLLIRRGSEEATAFKFDHGGRIYLVTTRHFANDLPLSNAVVEVLHAQT